MQKARLEQNYKVTVYLLFDNRIVGIVIQFK